MSAKRPKSTKHQRPKIDTVAQAILDRYNPDYHHKKVSGDQIESRVRERFGYRNVRPVQRDAIGSVLAGKDTVVHAPTGSGKSTIMAAPLLWHKGGISVVISPLILLQNNQQRGLDRAYYPVDAALTALSYTYFSIQDVRLGKYQIILMSPEMALENEAVRKTFLLASFMKKVVGVFIDEAHCISQWGGDFRKAYGRLGSLKALFPKAVPFCLLSASFRPRVLQDVMPMVYTAKSYEDLDFLVEKGTEDINSILSTIVYIDNVMKVTDAVIYLNNRLGPLLRKKGIIRPINAWLPSDYRVAAMDALVDGSVRIVICTEAAGMGCDIPNVALVVQLGLCSSIDGLIQRIGRAARSGLFQGRGVLIAEPWAWEGVGGKQGTQNREKHESDLIDLVNDTSCLRRHLNDVYANPPLPAEDMERAPWLCCGNCNPEVAAGTTVPKTKGSRKTGVKRRKGLPLPLIQKALKRWRDDEFLCAESNMAFFSSDVIMNDTQVDRIASFAPIASPNELRSLLDGDGWNEWERYGDSLWSALEAIDIQDLTSPKPPSKRKKKGKATTTTATEAPTPTPTQPPPIDLANQAIAEFMPISYPR
ncbi:hypothetical protein BOTBODRAFT_620316, partial [Botryobasidium botryosum FD-172 SS1]